MALIHVRDREGTEHEVEAQEGARLMEILRELDYGVVAICGGILSCATCHVHVDAAWAPKLPDPTPDEQALLSELVQRKSESRLSCQIEFSAALDGLRVTIAPEE